MWTKIVKNCSFFVILVITLNLLINSLVVAPVCEANLLSTLSTQLVGADVNSILHLVLHLKDIKKTLDPIIALLQTLIPILQQVSQLLGILEKLQVL